MYLENCISENTSSRKSSKRKRFTDFKKRNRRNRTDRIMTLHDVGKVKQDRHRADALALRADERRDKLRKSRGEEQISIEPRMSEWGTRQEELLSSCTESIGVKGTWELKHQVRRKRKKHRFPGSGEKRKEPKPVRALPGLRTVESEPEVSRTEPGKAGQRG